jgi:hypothetical protein
MCPVPHTPERRQSIRPSVPVLFGILAILVTMIAVIAAVGLAVNYGGSSCPNLQGGTGNHDCR